MGGNGSITGTGNVRKAAGAFKGLARGQQFQPSGGEAREDGQFDAFGQVGLWRGIGGSRARRRRGQLQAERHQEDQPTDDCLKNAEPAGDALRQAASDPLRPQMQVRQCRRIHHGKGGVFQPAFENVGLRIHAGSMGEGAIRRIGI